MDNSLQAYKKAVRGQELTEHQSREPARHSRHYGKKRRVKMSEAEFFHHSDVQLVVVLTWSLPPLSDGCDQTMH